METTRNLTRRRLAPSILAVLAAALSGAESAPAAEQRGARVPSITAEQAIELALMGALAPEFGANDLRISSMGATGDADYEVLAPAVAYNGTANEYLVVWPAEDDSNGLVDGEFEIFGQRIDAAIGAEVGSDDFRISDMGGTGNVAFGGFSPAVAYNEVDDEYLVVWSGDDNVGGLVDNENEIFGQRIDGTSGAEVGTNDFRISDAGGTGVSTFDAFNPAVAYNANENEYLVVWHSDEDVGGLLDGESEIFGQRIDGATGAELGSNDFRISDMGGTGDVDFGARGAAVAYNGMEKEYLVVWSGEDDVGGLVKGEGEIFGQRLDGPTGAELGSNDFRISDLGGTGAVAFIAQGASVAYNGRENEYLVVWEGDDNVGGLIDDELEIFGQRLDGAAGAEVGANDFRISEMGGTGDADFDARRPTAIYSDANREYLVVWQGDDDTGGLVDDESEIFAQRIDGASGVPVGDDLRISSAGGTGSVTYGAFDPVVAARLDGETLVAWDGDDDVELLVDDEFEIFGHLIAAILVFADGFDSGNFNAWIASP